MMEEYTMMSPKENQREKKIQQLEDDIAKYKNDLKEAEKKLSTLQAPEEVYCARVSNKHWSVTDDLELNPYAVRYIRNDLVDKMIQNAIMKALEEDAK